MSLLRKSGVGLGAEVTPLGKEKLPPGPMLCWFEEGALPKLRLFYDPTDLSSGEEVQRFLARLSTLYCSRETGRCQLIAWWQLQAWRYIYI